MLASGRARTLDTCVRYLRTLAAGRVDVSQTKWARTILMRPATKYLQLIERLFGVLPSDRICMGGMCEKREPAEVRGDKKKSETEREREREKVSKRAANENALICSWSSVDEICLKPSKHHFHSSSKSLKFRPKRKKMYMYSFTRVRRSKFTAYSAHFKTCRAALHYYDV